MSATFGEAGAVEPEREEWDGPWKEALDGLPLVFELFWPDVLAEVDLRKGWTPLQQELQALTPDSNPRLLRVDKLFELAARTSGDPRFAHFEAQMTKDSELPWRMFRYGRRAGEQFSQPVGRFAILGDEDPDWKPAEYREGVLGCQDLFTFRVAKLSEWRGRTGELESGDNLFGLFLCAHLATMATRGDTPARQDAKYRLLANLMRRDISPDDFRRWYRLMDWIMKLPAEANRAVWLRLQEIKEPRTMSHVTFAEIIGIEKGRTEGLQEALRGLLLTKFPQAGPSLIQEFEDETNTQRLRDLLQAAGLAASLEEFRSRLASPGSAAGAE